MTKIFNMANLGSPFERDTAALAGEYGKRVPMCISEDTKILTNDGFKGIDELSYKDKVATLDINGCLIYQGINDIYQYPFDGELIEFKNKYFTSLVNDNHLLYVSKNKHKFEFIEANKLYKEKSLDNFYIKQSINGWEGLSTEYFEIPRVIRQGIKVKEYPSRKINMDYWVKFLGNYLADGSLSGRDKVQIAKIDPLVKDIYYTNAFNCGFKVYKTKSGIMINDFQLNHYFMDSKNCGAVNKYIPKNLKDLNSNTLKLLSDSMYLGDGGKKESRYYTKSERLAYDYFDICFKQGYNLSITRRKSGIYYISQRCKKEAYAIGYRNKPIKVRYTGRIWCVNIDNHIILCLRNGKVHWTGNSGALGTSLGISNLCGDCIWDFPWMDKKMVGEAKHGYKGGGDGKMCHECGKKLDKPLKDTKSILIRREIFDKHFKQAKQFNFLPFWSMKIKYTSSKDGLSNFIIIPHDVMEKVLKSATDIYKELEETKKELKELKRANSKSKL